MCNTPIMDTSVKCNIFEGIAVTVYNQKATTQNTVNVQNFAGINNLNLLAKDSKGNAIYCPDQYVGVINIDEKGTCWETFRSWGENFENYSKTISNSEYKTLVIVIESPHKEEFENGKAIGPAMGNTGCNILGYFPKMAFEQLVNGDLQDLKIRGRYKVVLVNAIQYQCSLGEGTKNYRSEVFRGVWDYCCNNIYVVKEDFEKRLKSHNADIVINACTSTGDSNRKSDVQEVINKCAIINKLKCGHPSRWDVEKNREITKAN